MHLQPPTHRTRQARWLRRTPPAILALLPLLHPSASLRAETALRAGEALTYSVRWAVLPGAGQIRIAAAHQDTGHAPQLSITTETETRGIAKALIPFHAHAESTFDLSTGRLVSLRENSVARARRTEYSVHFDYESRRALFSGSTAEASRALELPDGDPADLITTLMKTRRWEIQPGESRDVLVSFRDQFYLVTVHAARFEQVKTPLGTFETLLLEPRMEKTPPKGMFKRGAKVRVWVSRDESRLPVRFEVEYKIGTGVATLVEYMPPVVVDVRSVADE